MALVVETGSGRSAADAFETVAYLDAYHSARGNTTWTGETADKEAAIIRATAWLSESFTWAGHRLKGRSQGLAWPRVGIVDRDGNSVPSSEVPVEVKKALAEAALRELVTPNALVPDYTPSKRLKTAKVGPLQVEYDLSRPDAGANRPILHVVADLIDQFLAGGGGTRVTGEVHR